MSKPKTGTQTLKGSGEARRSLSVVLETLSGLRGPAEAAEALSVSLSRYYQLETRALQGMLSALEPRARGPRKTPEKAILLLEREKRALEREVSRHQALLRAAQRTVGHLPRKKGAPAKRRHRSSRGARVLRTLRESTPEEGGVHGTADEGTAVAGDDRGERAGA